MSDKYTGSTGPTTRLNGAPVPTEQHSITTGPQGGINLHDVHLLEKLAHFNRERIPERVVHAKGSGAFGELVITEDVSKYTKAAVFQPGEKTEMLARFSTVAGEQGSPDGWRDVRGFALRFYSREGNLDIVGNNTPIFFIRDGIKFPDFIHSQKRLPDTGLRDANMQWDFWTSSPESAHQVTYLMGDRGIPKTFRHMDGFGSHTYQWINAEGERFWVKYHFKTRQGWEFLTDAEAEELVGQNTDHSRQDLFEAIERGDYPVWDLKVQIMPYHEAATYKFNPFDLTKTWSQQDYPQIPVGHFTLNRNPGNFFAEVEQAAFAPSNMVPGVGYSPDKMLLARAFAYADAHRYRLGVNSDQLPVNQPKCPVNSFSQDGQATYFYSDPKLPVHGSNVAGRGPVADSASAAKAAGCPVHSDHAGEVDATAYGQWEGQGENFYAGAYVQHEMDDDFFQPGELVRRVMDDAARDRLAGNIVRAMEGVSPEVEQRVYQYWTNVDEWLGAEVEKRYKAAHAE